MTVDQLLQAAGGQLESAKLTFMPGVRLHQFDYPVNAFLQAVYDQKSPAIPAKKTNYLRMYRNGYRVWRARIDRNRFNLLSAKQGGQTLNEAIETCLIQVPAKQAEKVAAAIGVWFKEWAADGMFAAIKLSGTMKGRKVG